MTHPNGPRNFGTLLRDGLPLPRDVIDRVIALDTQHPTLTELRAAFGVDLDTNASNEAARAAWPADPADQQGLARAVDAWYAAATSSRLVRVEISDDGLHVSAPPAAINVREGVPVRLWLCAENKTADATNLSAGGQARSIDAGRNGSMIVDAGTPVSGTQTVTLAIDATGHSTSAGVPVECHAAGTLRLALIDDATGAPTAARVYVRDDLGETWPDGAIVRRDRHGNVFFHADGAFEARITGTARVRVLRGIEYEAATKEITVAAGATADAELRLRRWSHKSAEGWYSGDVHVHLHYGGEYLLTPEDASLTQRAEDVHFMNMMVANQRSGWVHDKENFSGSDHALSDAEHILRWGEEYRNNFYGHMCMFGIRELVPPIYSGFPNSEHAHDLPSNADAAAHCHRVGGTLSYAHPMFDSIDLDRVFAPEHRLSVEAKELPVDAALGHIDAFDVLSYPGHTIETCKLWYRLLSCGLRLAGTAGTDTFMNTCDSGVFSNPPAGDRVFVRVDGPLTTEAWCGGARAGRTFVTNGPMLTLDVAGHGIGDEIAATPGSTLRVEATATSAVRIDHIELIVDGGVAASASAANGRAALSHDLRVERTCWIAVRCSGPVDERVLDPDGAFAHTSPVYVTVDGAPQRSAEDAAYFVDWIDRLIAVTEERARYPDAASRDRVIAQFREAQSYYRGA